MQYYYVMTISRPWRCLVLECWNVTFVIESKVEIYCWHTQQFHDDDVILPLQDANILNAQEIQIEKQKQSVTHLHSCLQLWQKIEQNILFLTKSTKSLGGIFNRNYGSGDVGYLVKIKYGIMGVHFHLIVGCTRNGGYEFWEKIKTREMWWS